MAAASDDKALIAAAQEGDEAAFEQLVLRHRDRVFWLARRVVGNAEDARDVAQNVLVRLWRVLPHYNPEFAFTTWLHRMTVNLAIDHVRRVAPRRKDTELDEGLVVHEAGRLPAAERAASGHEVERILDELAGLLPPQQRAAFALRELQGLTSEEAAEILGVSSSTVRNHLFQARRTLRRELERRYPEYLPADRRGGSS